MHVKFTVFLDSIFETRSSIINTGDSILETRDSILVIFENQEFSLRSRGSRREWLSTYFGAVLLSSSNYLIYLSHTIPLFCGLHVWRKLKATDFYITLLNSILSVTSFFAKSQKLMSKLYLFLFTFTMNINMLSSEGFTFRKGKAYCWTQLTIINCPF